MSSKVLFMLKHPAFVQFYSTPRVAETSKSIHWLLALDGTDVKDQNRQLFYSVDLLRRCRKTRLESNCQIR